MNPPGKGEKKKRGGGFPYRRYHRTDNIIIYEESHVESGKERSSEHFKLVPVLYCTVESRYNGLS